MKRADISWKKYTLLFFCLAVAFASFAGCSVNKASSSKEEVVFWQPDLANWQPLYEELVKDFEEKHPDIDVKMANIPEEGYFEKMNTAFAAGQGPDVWVGWYSIDEYARGYIEPLDEYIERDAYDMNEFFQPITDLRLKGADGKNYGLPRDISMSVVLYNKDLFDKYGVSYPTDDWTSDEFRSIAQKLTQPDEKIYGTDMAGSDWSFITGGPALWNAGSDLVSEDGWTVSGLMDSPQTIEAFEFLQSVVKDGSNIPSAILETMSGDNAGFVSGTVAMSAGSLWGFNTVKEVPFNWGVASFPKAGGDQYAWVDIVNWHMNSKSKHKDAAWEFMKYMSSPEVGKVVAKELTWGPPRPQTWIDEGFDSHEQLGVFLQQGSKPTKTPSYLRNNKWWEAQEAYGQAVTDMLNPLDGKELADPKTALEQAAKTVQAKLDELKNQ